MGEGEGELEGKEFFPFAPSLFRLSPSPFPPETPDTQATPNGKSEFVPRDQIFPLIVVNCLLLQLKNK